jgi:hypothetical protein
VKTLLLALATLALVGCGIHPVGPLANHLPGGGTEKAKPLPEAPVEPLAKAPAIKPTPPTMYVTPGDVSVDNPYIAANKLTSELGVDSKSSPNVPVTAEVSRYKGGVKQQ